VAADDLTAPLGQDTKPGKRWSPPAAPATLIAGVLGLALAVFAGWAMFVSDPMGGEPSVVVGLPSPAGGAARPEAAPKLPESGAQPSPPAAAPPQPNPSVVTIIDGTTGKRQEVPIGGEAEGKAGGGDQRLLESTRHGLIPKIAADGTRPADAYARPMPANPANANAPRVAIVVTGLGVGAKLTADAIGKLPGPVTLAFTPYGTEATRAVAKAREAGHEVLLQVPMEPFDYPDNDPGPQTLLTTLTAEQNIDRLYWLMSRFQGYVGLVNYMGTRFTATEAAFAPVIKETAKRGLIYFDDGASQRSLAAQIAGASNLSFAKTDVILDAVPTQAEMSKAFSKLEALARANGAAIGVTSALPVSIERILQWAKSAESRGFVLVPISAAATRSKPS
jgi:polysaccharide deacetylase 2 family uncharacterized protein YibQ